MGVGAQGFGVEAHGQGVLPLLAGLVTAANALQEFGLAQAAGAGRPLRPPEGLGRRGRRGARRRREGRIGAGPVVGAGTEERELRRERARVNRLSATSILKQGITKKWPF